MSIDRNESQQMSARGLKLMPGIVFCLALFAGCGGDSNLPPISSRGRSEGPGMEAESDVPNVSAQPPSPSATPDPTIVSATPEPPATTNADMPTESADAAEAPQEPPKSEPAGETPAAGLFGLASGTPAATSDSGSAVVKSATKLNSPATDLSPDGRILAAERGKGKLKLYDVQRRTSLSALSTGVDDLHAVRFDPKSQLVAAALPDGSINVWKSATADGLDEFARSRSASESSGMRFAGHSSGTHALAFSPLTGELLSAGGDGFLRIWNLTESVVDPNFRQPSATPLFAVVSGDGNHAAAILRSGMIARWDLQGGKLSETAAPAADCTAICLSPSGDWLAVADQRGRVYVSGPEDSAPIELSLFETQILDMRFEPDPARLTMLAADGSVGSVPVPLEATAIVGLATAGGSQLSLSADRSVAAWPVGSGLISVYRPGDKVAVGTWKTSLKKISAVDIVEDDRVLIVGDGVIEQTGSSGLQDSLKLPGFDGRQVVSGRDRTAAIVSASGDLAFAKFGTVAVRPSDQHGAIVAAAFDDTGKLVASLWRSGRVSILDTATGEITAAWDVKLTKLTAIAISEKSRTLAVGNAAGEILLYNLLSPDRPRTVGPLNTEITVLRFLPDGSGLCAGSRDGTTCLFPVTTDNRVQEIRVAGVPMSVAVAASGESGVLISAGKATAFSFVDQRANTYNDIADATRVALSPDQTLVAILGSDGEFGVFDQKGKLSHRFPRNPADPVVDLKFHPVDRRLLCVTASGDLFRQPVTRQAEQTVALLTNASAASVNSANSSTAVVLPGGIVKITGLINGKPADREIRCKHKLGMLTWLGDNQLVASTEDLPGFLLLDISTGESRHTASDKGAFVRSMCTRRSANEVWFTSKTGLGVVTNMNGVLRIFDVPWDGTESDTVTCFGERLLVHSGSRVFEVVSGKSLVPYAAFSDVAGISGSVDGRRLLAWRPDGTLLALDDAETRVFASTDRAPFEPVGAVVSVGGDYIVWGDDGVAVQGRISAAGFGEDFVATQLGGMPLTAWWLPSEECAAVSMVGGGGLVVPATSEKLFSSGVASVTQMSLSTSGEAVAVVGSTTGRLCSMSGEVKLQFEVAEAKNCSLSVSNEAVWLGQVGGTLRKFTATEVVERNLDGAICGLALDSERSELIVAVKDSADLSYLSAATLEPLRTLQLETPPAGLFSSLGDGLIVSDVGQRLRRVGDARIDVGLSVPAKRHNGACHAIAVARGAVWSVGADGSLVRWTEADPQFEVLFRHTQSLTSLLTEANGNYFLAGDAGGNVYRVATDINDAQKIEFETVSGGFVPIAGAAPSFLAGISGSEVIRREKAGQVAAWRFQHPLSAAYLSPDGMRGVAITAIGDFVEFGFPRATELRRARSGYNGLHRASDGQFVVVSGSVADVFDGSGRLLSAVPTGISNATASTVCVETGRLAISGAKGEIEIWDLKSRGKVAQLSVGRPVSLLRLSPSGNKILVGFGENTVEEWDSRAGRRLRTLSGHRTVVSWADFLRDQTGILTSDISGEIRQWQETAIVGGRLENVAGSISKLMPSELAAAVFNAGKLTIRRLATEKSEDLDYEGIMAGVFARAEQSGAMAVLRKADSKLRAVVRRRGSAEDLQVDVASETTGLWLSGDGRILVAYGGGTIETVELATGRRGRRQVPGLSGILYVGEGRELVQLRDGSVRYLGSNERGAMRVSQTAVGALALNKSGDRIVTGP